MNELTVKQTNDIDFSNDQIKVIKATLLDTADTKFNNDELQLFLYQCKRTKLDPFTRQIYATKNKKTGKISIQTTIDGFRVIAERSKVYAGQTKPIWFDNDGNKFNVWPNAKGLPYACEVGVLRHDFKEPVYAVAIFDEYAQTNYDKSLSFMWAKMPALMISKVAEALALRKAFPNDLSGIYSQEEMQQQDQAPQSTEFKDITPQKEIKSEYIIDIGEKHLNKKLSEVPIDDIKKFLQYLKNKKEKTDKEKIFFDEAIRYLNTVK